MSSLILASASPRRKSLLSELYEPFSIVPADIDESRIGNENPMDYVARVAKLKAQRIAEIHPNSIVLASDTCVAMGNTIFGKPNDVDDAKRILRCLSGSEHQVLTAIVTISEGVCQQQTIVTRVRFTELNDSQIAVYCQTNEPLDKAGAYGIQGYASRFVTSIDGSYSGVIGLPLVETATMLRNAGLILKGDE